MLCAVCLAQQRIPTLSLGNALEALTPAAAFQVQSSPDYSLRSNFDDETLRRVAQGAQEFALDFLLRVSVEVEKHNADFMISPFSVWSLLVLMYEGAGGQTYEQLRQALRINVEDEKLRSIYNVWSKYLK